MSWIRIDNSFRLNSLKLKGHPIFNDIALNFTDENDVKFNQLYFSVLIGPNGTGKSEILKVILLLFKSLHFKITDKKELTRKYFFRLDFINNGKKFSYYNYEEDNLNLIALDKSGKRYPKPKLSLFGKEIFEYENYKIVPSSIISQSIMLTDKFIVPRNTKEVNDFKIYNYLGLRNRPQQASTRSYVRRTIELIVNNVQSNRFQEGLIRMMNFLELPSDVIIKYRTTYTTKFFKGNLTVDELKFYFQEIENKYEGKQAPYKLNHFRFIERTKNLGDLVNFVNNLYYHSRLEDIPRSSVKYLAYNLDEVEDHKALQKEYDQLDDLRKIGLLSVPDIRIEDSKVALQEMSSGEFHFFSTIVGLLAAVEKQSLVLIDEPEISLHPNWQMKYLSFIRELFLNEAFAGTHFIIATHSHFLISDLNGDSGNIIGLKKQNGKISSLEIHRDTYGWSAEQVLLDVFDVQTTRNYIVAERIGEMLDFIAQEESTQKQISLKFYELGLDKLRNLPQNDPLKTVLNTIIREYV